jgi:hypothetical protein
MRRNAESLVLVLWQVNSMSMNYWLPCMHPTSTSLATISTHAADCWLVYASAIQVATANTKSKQHQVHLPIQVGCFLSNFYAARRDGHHVLTNDPTYLLAYVG